ncbi:minor teichoic acid biosynthesis protein GgaB [Clostridia bacterium]|nr:minor teichoic acid biosynthesis protein GgaB [Clostridia bacterium]
MSKLSKFDISVIIPVYNCEDYIGAAIDSVVKQTYGFDKIQLILVDNNSTDNSVAICRETQKEFPNNVLLLKQDKQGVSATRNLGIEHIEGEYTCFLDGDDMLPSDFIEKCAAFMELHRDEVDFVLTPIHRFDSRVEVYYLSRRLTTTEVVDLTEKPEIFTMLCTCGMYLSEAVRRYRFDEELNVGEDALFVNKLILKKMKVGVVRETHYNYRKRIDGSSAIDNIEDDPKSFDRFERLYLALFEVARAQKKSVPQYVQHLVANSLNWHNARKMPPKILEKVDFDKLRIILKQLLRGIDDKIIATQPYLKRTLKIYFLMLKHGFQLFYSGAFHIGSAKFTLENTPLTLCVAEEKRGVVRFGGYYCLPEYEHTRLVVLVNGKQFECEERISLQHEQYYLNELVQPNMGFDVEVPFEGECVIGFYLENKSGVLFPVSINYGASCRLTSNKHSFFLGDNTIVTRTEKPNQLLAREFSVPTLRYMRDFEFDSYAKTFSRYLNLFIENFQQYRNRRIWVFIDRPDSAGDNAEALFRYAVKQKDGIEKFFIVRDNSTDYRRLKLVGNVVDYNSDAAWVLMFFAEKFISSHTYQDFPEWSTDMALRPLMRADNVFLQHGVIGHDISTWINKHSRRIDTFVTSNQMEFDDVTGGHYEFPKEVVKVTGLPRYDLLKSNPKKLIILAPSWRNSLNGINIAGTDYFECYNNLITDDKLLETLRNSGYKLCLKLHPKAAAQIYQFMLVDDVVADGSSKTYAEIFETGALLITDFSSVAFDFAYLDKPVLYYQKIPDHFEPNFFDYGTMGFGEVIFEQRALVDKIVEYIKNDCVIKDEYKNRAKTFFKFRDTDNSKRVYDELIGGRSA